MSAHKGQTDNGGNPYILHPPRAMMALDSETEKIVGVLHDVVEDSDWTFDDLEKGGFGPDALEALKSVTKNNDEHGTDGVISILLRGQNKTHLVEESRLPACKTTWMFQDCQRLTREPAKESISTGGA